jgi:hypothetical protein
MLKPSSRQATKQQVDQSIQQQQQQQQSSSKLVQRLLIFYPELPTLCDGRIDESSSEEELTEHILYFHDETSPSFGTDSPRYATEEAIQFLGLCSALYTFPSAFDNDDGSDHSDRSQEVKFGKSTLVFCPLEKGELLAVIQVSSGEPFALRSSVERSHGIFSLLRGGGVIPRLLSKEHVPNAEVIDMHQASISNFLDKSFVDLNDDMPPDISDVIEFEPDNRSQDTISADDISTSYEDDGCIYSGMKSVYRLRKKIRRKKAAIAKVSELLKLKRQTMKEDLEETIKTLLDLYAVLPILSLRREMKAHYDEYLADSSLCNRCLVETIPLPIRRGGMNLPATPTAAASIQLGHSTRALLKHTLQTNEAEDPFLVGITSFYRGSILYTHTLQDLNEDTIDIGISNATACQIMRYMTYFEQRMQNQPNDRLRMRMARASSLQSLRQNLQDSLQQFGNRSSHNKKSSSTTVEQEEMVSLGQYLASPPLSMLNLFDELSEINDGTLGNIWAPTFYVSVGGRYLTVQAALYSLNDYSFLVFFHSGTMLGDMSPNTMQLSATSFYDNYFSDNHALSSNSASGTKSDSDEDAEEQTPIARLLVDVSLHLSMCVTDLSPLTTSTTTAPDEMDAPQQQLQQQDLEREKGVDIVFVDRLQQDVVILPSTSKRQDRNSRLLALGLRKGRKADQHQQQMPARDDGILATDLRHQLLSKFSSEVADAFDDLMKEVHQAKTKEKDNNDKTNDIELCTYLPHGWVWAASSGARELYVLFDPNVYDTVTNVQQNAERLRHRFFYEQVVLIE